MLTPLAEAVAISSGLTGRLDIPIAAVPSMIAAMPVVDPSAAISKLVPGCCALNSSANCGTSFAPNVSDPLMTRLSAHARGVPMVRAMNVRSSFFILLFGCVVEAGRAFSPFAVSRKS